MRKVTRIELGSVGRDTGGEENSYPEPDPAERNAQAPAGVGLDDRVKAGGAGEKNPEREAAMEVGPKHHEG